RENYEEFAPFYLETIRQILVSQLGENMVLDKGLRIHASLDLEKQKAAQDAMIEGLKALDKRQGYRGPLKNLTDEEEITKFLEDNRKKLIAESTPERIILPEGKFADIVPPLEESKEAPLLPAYLKLGDSIQ